MFFIEFGVWDMNIHIADKEGPPHPRALMPKRSVRLIRVNRPWDDQLHSCQQGYLHSSVTMQVHLRQLLAGVIYA